MRFVSEIRIEKSPKRTSRQGGEYTNARSASTHVRLITHPQLGGSWKIFSSNEYHMRQKFAHDIHLHHLITLPIQDTRAKIMI